MKITLYRYLIKEQIVPMGVCVLGLTLILITGRLLQLLRYLFASSVTLLDIVELMVLAMPKLMLYALPMASLLAVLLAFLRLNGDNELIAFRAAGISFGQFFPMVMVVLLFITTVSYFNTLLVIPFATTAFESKLRSLARAGLPILMKEGTFIDTIPKMVFFFRSVNPTDLSIDGVFLEDEREPRVRVAIVAEHAAIAYSRDQNQLIFRITNGIITRIGDEMKDAQAVSFKVYDLSLSLDDLFGLRDKVSKSRGQMTLRELLEKIRETSKIPGVMVRFALEFQQRLALPFSCLLLGLIGAPLGVLFKGKGRMTGVTLGLGVFLAYYIALSAGRGLGENCILSPLFATWLPNILTLAAAGYFWLKIQRETPFGLADAWNHIATRYRSSPAIRRLPDKDTH